MNIFKELHFSSPTVVVVQVSADRGGGTNIAVLP